MATLPQQTLNHFLHPNHTLHKISDTIVYVCDGCKDQGCGKRYGCHSGSCNFDLHDFCANALTVLSSYLHPDHGGLNLLFRASARTEKNESGCCVCGEFIEGMFYRCSSCPFVVHPICTQLPQKVPPHQLHPKHPLTLQRSSPRECLVCEKMCKSWRYRCSTCSGADIHFDCISPPPAPAPAPAETSQRSAGRPPTMTGTDQKALRYVPPSTSQHQSQSVQLQPQFQPQGYAAHPYPNPYHINQYMYPYHHPHAFQPQGYAAHPYPNPYHNQNMYPYHNPHAFQPQGGVTAANGAGRKRMMFMIVAQLAFGVLTGSFIGV